MNLTFSLLIFSSTVINVLAILQKNACKNWPDYLSYVINPNCYYDSDMELETPEIIKKHIGRVETYDVVADDGYITKIFRMPKDNYKGVILLHHSLSIDSRGYAGQHNNSLAFYLWYNGYEVWLNNDRGSQHSQKHKTLNPREFQFWNFSFHEIGYYDVPQEIQLIKKVSKVCKIIYIGHSQGTSAGMVYGALKPDEAKDSIATFIFMATPGYYTWDLSPVRLLTPFESLIKTTVSSLKLGSVFLSLPIGSMSKRLFRIFPPSLILVNLAMSFVLGWTPTETDPRVVNLDGGVYLQDFAWKNFLHYLQLCKIKTRFQYFDYGEDNLKHYSSKTPPVYPIEKIKVPIFFVSSVKDAFTPKKGTDLFIERLRNTTSIMGHLVVPKMNHMDYHFGADKKEIYFEKLLDFIKTIPNCGNSKNK